MERIGAVVFDIGNVLIEWNPKRFYDHRIGPERRRALFNAVDLDAMNLQVDLGAPLSSMVSKYACEHPQWADEIRLWESCWIEMASPEIPASVAALRQLHSCGIPVFALSNFGNETFDMALSHYPFLDLFDRRFLSGALGFAKPAFEIYAVLETQTGIAAERLLFADDRADNIAAAQARGWQTHHFTDAQGWIGRLRAEGLLKRPQAKG